MQFDLSEEALALCLADGQAEQVALRTKPSPAFTDVMDALRRSRVAIRIDEAPCEIAGATSSHEDHAVRAFDGELPEQHTGGRCYPCSACVSAFPRVFRQVQPGRPILDKL